MITIRLPFYWLGCPFKLVVPDDDEDAVDSDEHTVSLSLLPTLFDSTLGSTSVINVITPTSLAFFVALDSIYFTAFDVLNFCQNSLAISSGNLVDLVSSSGSATIYPSDNVILAVLQARFRADLPYTGIGSSTLILTKFSQMSTTSVLKSTRKALTRTRLFPC